VFPDWRRDAAGTRRRERLRYGFCDPQRDERFARAAGHDGGNAVVSFQRGKQGVQRFSLVRLRRFFRRDVSGVGQPGFHRAEVTGFHAIQVRATDAEETLAVVEDGGQFVAVREQHAAVNLRAVGQADEGGEFAPRQRRASGAELDLIGVELAEQRLQHPVHALIRLREAEMFQGVQRDGTVRPDLRGVVFPLRGEISLGKNFKRRTARLFVGQRGDLRFQFGKAGQASEQMSLDEEGRFGMASRCHAGRVSICLVKKSLRHPFRVEIIFDGYPG